MARPPTESIAVETPLRILAAAEVAFATHGFVRARLADIAAVAGLRRPSLLYHFPSKELLYAAVIRAAFARLGASLLASRSAPGGFAAQLAAVTLAFDAFLSANPVVARLIVQEIVAEAGPGQALLVGEVAPLLDDMQAWITTAGGSALRPDVSVRAAVMHVVSDALLRHASGPLRRPIWGAPSPETSWHIARTLLIVEESS